MHIPEGALPIGHAIAWSVVAIPFALVGVAHWRHTRRDGDPARAALFAMSSALCFTVTLFPIPVPVAGASSHLCATPLLALLLGPRIVVIPTLVTLLLQALFFAHGGVTTLGANVVTLGVVGPFVGWALARGLRRAGMPALWCVGLACFAADLAVYLVDAGILGLALSGGRSFVALFRTVVLGFLPTQLPLAILEGVASAWIIRSLARRRSDLLPAWLLPRTAGATGTPARAGIVAVALAIWLASAGWAAAASYPGLDDSVFGRVASVAGHAPRASGLIDFGSESFVALLAAATFAAGVVVGRGWTQLGRGARVETTRAP